MTQPHRLARHALGYWYIDPAPSIEELRAFYLDKYYPTGDGNQKILQYAADYEPLELEHKRIAGREALRVLDRAPGTVLEIGVGEGFFLNEFSLAGWQVRGVDFNADAVRKWHPHLADAVTVADIGADLATRVEADEHYDVVALNNVIEHVLDPILLMTQVRRLLVPGGVTRVAMPNEASWIQRAAVALDHAEDRFWVMPPEHLSYFDIESAGRLMEHCGLSVLRRLADYPIDMFLLARATAYTLDRQIGHAAHQVRLRFETELARRAIDQLVAFREGCAAAGVGRNLIVYAGAAT